MDIVNTVTGIAEKYLGEVERYREVYKDNPAILMYRLPPSAQTSIDLLNKQGIKIPSTDAINSKLANIDTEIGKAVGNLFRDGLATVDQSGVERQVRDGLALIQSLDWLL